MSRVDRSSPLSRLLAIVERVATGADGPPATNVHSAPFVMYSHCMDVAVTDFRAHLSDWLQRVQTGSEIVITERGIPIARILGVESTSTLTRLIREGVIAQPLSDRRPPAANRQRPRPRRPVADRVSEQRR